MTNRDPKKRNRNKRELKFDRKMQSGVKKQDPKKRHRNKRELKFDQENASLSEEAG